MKKAILFAMMAAVLGFTACSKEEPIQDDINQTEAPRKGMVLRAIVEQPTDTKATFTDNEGVWHFDFEEGDIIKVTNKEIGADRFYTFTYDGEKFVSEDAEPTTGATTWYANFPSNKVSLVEQSGAWKDIADKYVMTGSTTDEVTGEDGLSITMSPQVAILKIINLKDDVSINVKNSSTTWVSGYKAEKGSIKDFYMLDPIYSDTKQTLLSATEPGTYYIAVPADKQLVIKDGDKTLKSTGTSGLTAGKYYELTIGLPFGQGYAEVDASAGIPGNKVKWIQLWEGGPKFAEFNLGATSVTDCGVCWSWIPTLVHKDDDAAAILWGSKWRMPTKEELELIDDSNRCTNKSTTLNNVNGLLCTGKNAYASNSVFFPAVEEDGEVGYYWSSTFANEMIIERFCMEVSFIDEQIGVYPSTYQYTYHVRAVLAE